MSRRLSTVLRVAELQERVAKAEAGRLRAAVVASEQVRTDRLAGLAAARPVAGRAVDLQTGAAVLALRAQAAVAAGADVTAAEQARTAGLQRWSAARSRSRLLEQLDARQRAERDAAQVGAAQRLADDLSASRRPTGGDR